jgi:hypothetical protein
MLKDIVTLLAILFGAVGSLYLPLIIFYSTPTFFPQNVSIFLLLTIMVLIAICWLQIKNIYSEKTKHVRNARISLIILLTTTLSLSAYILWILSMSVTL